MHILRLLGYASRILYPEKRDYHLAVRWQTLLRRKGSPIPAVDLIIAAQAYNRDLTLITRDKHFELLKREVAPDLKLILEGE
ncbi:MAG: PIN domain-containing protein [Desulfurococcales archaeon]|nr:PIN domain-containing protein [Desulfurococcales archaeon]